MRKTVNPNPARPSRPALWTSAGGRPFTPRHERQTPRFGASLPARSPPGPGSRFGLGIALPRTRECASSASKQAQSKSSILPWIRRQARILARFTPDARFRRARGPSAGTLDRPPAVQSAGIKPEAVRATRRGTMESARNAMSRRSSTASAGSRSGPSRELFRSAEYPDRVCGNVKSGLAALRRRGGATTICADNVSSRRRRVPPDTERVARGARSTPIRRRPRSNSDDAMNRGGQEERPCRNREAQTDVVES